ncbi:GNAT family N-acetyltransferase [Hymenobacter aerilatus]|uniref:GNAT family N-acetyltransferase n=1 Tax=Hymenobacter aerilatus TaxID=2932251 RepID=A0A8T9T007_9BACT|nr:GNAT family N-acetyltransferase [Hymenobacter aerilatus]UOR05436.1 GNAT family N-acetyltransferase [Hymenobacter aerilatus]
MPVAASLFVAPPLTTLTTARLTLRPYAPADEEDFFALLDHERHRLRPSFPARVAATTTPADATRVLATFLTDWRSDRLYVFGIWHTATAAYLGDISLRPQSGRTRTAEIGYYLARSAEGCGYAREALAAAGQFGFDILQVATLSIRCRANNPRSCAVAKAVGFRQLPTRSRLWPLRRHDAEEEILYFALTRPISSAQ